MDTVIRFSAALSIFLLMISWEMLSPRRPLTQTRWQRWSINLGLAACNMLVVRFTLGSIAYVSALKAQQSGWGLLPTLALPHNLQVACSLLCLDAAIYLQHIAMHRWSPLWRLHQVHHSDMDFDASTAVRFHPLEILLSLAYKVVCIMILGADPTAVVAFEVLLNASATFNHGNVKLSESLDYRLRWLVVTPDMHRIHHSTLPNEANSNYGFSISLWDRLFNTYTPTAQHEQTTMPIGIEYLRDPKALRFYHLLLLPFKRR